MKTGKLISLPSICCICSKICSWKLLANSHRRVLGGKDTASHQIVPVLQRVPPGGSTNIILGDAHSATAKETVRKDHNNSNWTPSFDQSLHRSRTFQSTLFSTEAQAPSSTPTKAAKKTIAPAVNMPTLMTSNNENNVPSNQSPRPAKKSSTVVDRTLMHDILKPKIK